MITQMVESLRDLLGDPDVVLVVVASVSAFGLVLMLWVAGVWLWAMRRAKLEHQRRERLGLADPGEGAARMLRLWYEGEQVTTWVADDPRRRGMGRRFREMHQAAGMSAPLQSILLGLLGTIAALSLAAYLWTGSSIAAAGAAATGLLVFWAYVKRQISNRGMLFDLQLIDALGLAARSLRAGHPLGGAFHLIAEEVPAPVGTVFAEICEQSKLGASHEDALRKVAVESPSEDMKLFATSVSIQLRTGGNLADMMERLADVIRDRMRLNRRVSVLTAQTQLSKNTLLVLPFVMFATLTLMNPEYMATLYSTSEGRVLLAVAATGLLLGGWMMNKLAQLKY